MFFLQIPFPTILNLDMENSHKILVDCLWPEFRLRFLQIKLGHNLVFTFYEMGK